MSVAELKWLPSDCLLSFRTLSKVSLAMMVPESFVCTLEARLKFLAGESPAHVLQDTHLARTSEP